MHIEITNLQKDYDEDLEKRFKIFEEKKPTCVTCKKYIIQHQQAKFAKSDELPLKIQLFLNIPEDQVRNICKWY